MPLRGEFLPFLFGGLIGGACGAFLAANRFQVIFLGQGKLGNALICGHSNGFPKKGGSAKLSVAGKAKDPCGDDSIYYLTGHRAVQYYSILMVRRRWRASQSPCANLMVETGHFP
jgi:hypothetical protein